MLAESAAQDCPVRFLGLRFPAADIPEQARKLYRQNLLRIIGDVDAPPVALLSDAAGVRLDQSQALLRSPASIHVRYLQNMGVKATMTISLLQDGELWGMVSCQHDQPRAPPLHLRRMTKLLCTLLGEIVVMRLEAVLNQEIADTTLRFRNAVTQLLRDVGSGENFPAAVGQALVGLGAALKVSGHGLMLAGQWICAPAADPELSAFLLQKIRAGPAETIFCTECLRDETGLDRAAAGTWAGALVLRIPDTSDSFLVFLREEALREVHWGGAPGKTSPELLDGLSVIGPRQSFERWTEVMDGHSEPWTMAEKVTIRDVARTLGEARQTYSRQELHAELRMLGSCMEHLNDMVMVTDAMELDAHGPVIVYVNQAFVSTTGFGRDEVIGHSPYFLQGTGTDCHQVDILREAMQAWRHVTVELIIYKKKGDPFWLELSLAPMTDRCGTYSHWVAIGRSIDERKRSEAIMQRLAYFDPLTSLPNRRLLMDRLAVALTVSNRYDRNGALLFIDLDHFKDLNDTKGHQVGDELLRQVAHRLVAVVRRGDVVARLGGDEFVVMLENLSAEADGTAAAVQRIAEKIIDQLALPYDLVGYAYITTASLGIALFHDSAQHPSLEDLLKQADFAMYEAKAAGRNTWRFFDPTTQAALVEKNSLEADLKQAFANNQLSLYYQPIVDANRTVVGVEALIRWQHATRSWVSPVDFISIAEDTGLIIPIGKWVISQACALLKSWAADPVRAAWSIAVNVSAHQIRQGDFVEVVTQAIAQAGCNPTLLKLELTESVLQYDFDATITKMKMLRGIGVAFSIDDFGTGFSSLAYLQRLPISVLKIDHSFVRDIGHDESDMGICKMILALGKTLGLSIVAEGVETLAQYDFLRAHECDKFQGFLFSKALPADRLVAVAAGLQV